jgi:phosphate transport system permease protein
VSAAAPRLSRRLSNLAFLAFCWAATTLALIALAAILWSLVRQGVAGLDLAVFTRSTPAPGSEGGLLNAILGSIMMCAVAMAGAVAVGVLAGTWLSEYAGESRYGKVVRFIKTCCCRRLPSWSACSSTRSSSRP